MKTIRIPGDKSISHRAIIFSALSGQTVTIRNLLEGEDVLRTVEIFRKLGVAIQKRGKVWIVKGKRPADLHPYKGILYCGNSGTTMRLMMGVLAALPFKSRLTGDVSLNRRPMERVAKPLRLMGAKIGEIHRGEKRIIEVHGSSLKKIRYKMPVASAQLKSALLLAGLVANVPVKVTEPTRSRDHTERMIRLFRKPVRQLVIPGDPSSAAFFVLFGLLHSRIRIQNVGLNPTRTGFLDILKKMGGRFQIKNRREEGGEPIGDIVVIPSHLKGVSISGKVVPRLIDEVPILGVAAAFAKGKTVFQNMEELRVKESDRIDSIVWNFRRLGIPIVERKDGFTVEGKIPLKGGVSLKSFGDHRIAMSLLVLNASLSKKCPVQDTGCIQTSFPDFKRLLKIFDIPIGVD